MSKSIIPASSSRSAPPLMGPERRFATFEQIEVRTKDRADGTPESIGFKGHAAVFGVRSYIGSKPWGFFEEVRSGAFAKAIGESDVRFLHNHNPDLAFARSSISSGPGSLRLSEDKTGLMTDSDWVPTTVARDVAMLLDSRVVSQMSFSFLPVKEEWSVDDETGDETRTLLEVKLFDVSTVTFPAYTETDAALRSATMDLLLRETGDFDEETRVALARALRTGNITSDLAPHLRAAADALRDLAQKHEPPKGAPAEGDELRLRAERIQRQHRAYASAGAPWNLRSTTT